MNEIVVVFIAIFVLIGGIVAYGVISTSMGYEVDENKNYIPSFFIDSSAEGSKLINDVEHINIRYLQNIGTEFSQSKLNQLNTTKEEFFEKSLSLISEKKQLENQDIKKITLMLVVAQMDRKITLQFYKKLLISL